MKNRTINEKYKGNTYGKIKKWSVMWVRVNTKITLSDILCY